MKLSTAVSTTISAIGVLSLKSRAQTLRGSASWASPAKHAEENGRDLLDSSGEKESFLIATNPSFDSLQQEQVYLFLGGIGSYKSGGMYDDPHSDDQYSWYLDEYDCPDGVAHDGVKRQKCFTISNEYALVTGNRPPYLYGHPLVPDIYGFGEGPYSHSPDRFDTGYLWYLEDTACEDGTVKCSFIVNLSSGHHLGSTESGGTMGFKWRIDSTKLLICRIDSNGFAVTDPSKANTTPVYSQVTALEATTVASDVTFTAGAVMEAVGTGIDVFEEHKKLAASFLVAGTALNVASFWLGKSDTDITQTFIKNSFVETNKKIDALSAQMESGFERVLKTVYNGDLDKVKQRLRTIQVYYSDYLDSQGTASLDTHKKLFRDICNPVDLQYKPENLFWDLYRNLGGSNKNRKCTLPDGELSDRGSFLHSQEANLNYALDLYRDSAKGDASDFMNGFGYWALSTMAEAYSFHLLCLGPDDSTCEDRAQDSVFLNDLNEMTAAYDEAIDNIEQATACLQCTKKLELYQIYTYGAGEIDDLEIQYISINGEDIIPHEKKKQVETFYGSKTNNWVMKAAKNSNVMLEDMIPVYTKDGKLDITIKEFDLVGTSQYYSNSFPGSAWDYEYKCLTLGQTIGNSRNVVKRDEANNYYYKTQLKIGGWILYFNVYDEYTITGLDGEYSLQGKRSRKYWHENGWGDQLVTTRYQPNDDFVRFILESQPDRSYRIKVKGDGRYLHADCGSSYRLTTLYQPNDDATRFFFFKYTEDGSYQIKVKSQYCKDRYLNEGTDGLLSFRSFTESGIKWHSELLPSTEFFLHKA